MDISFDDSFPAERHHDLTRAAQDVMALVRTLIPGATPRGEWPVVCHYYDTPNARPFVQWPSPAPALYKIWLAGVGGWDYCKLAYQLAHELGHVMMDPSRDNGAVEILAVAVSLQALRDLSSKWARNPPYPHWRDFALEFASYADGEIAKELQPLSASVQEAVKVGEWDSVARFLLDQRAVLNEEPCE